MANETSHGAHQAGMFGQASSPYSHLDTACPSDELALYEGLEQLGVRSEQYPTQTPTNSHSTEHIDSTNVAINTSSGNELINVDHGNLAAGAQARLSLRSEDRDEFGLPPQTPTPSGLASSSNNEPATELDMYTAESAEQNPWAAEQYIERDSRSISVPAEANSTQTELDAYEVMRNPVTEQPGRDGAGGVMASHDMHLSNFGEGTSAEAATIQPSTLNHPESEEQSSPRRHNSIVLPRWQPDAEVTYCPICSTQFSWFNRKHHCRKCGRVVCAICSQHRVTIPHEFIVHPPQDTSSSDRRPSLSQRDTEAASTTCGGTKVRLCNPCVPDPNTLPPPPLRSADRERQRDRPTYLLTGFGDGQFRITEEALNAFEAMGNEQSAPVDRRRRATSYYTLPTVLNRAPFAESRFPQSTSSQACRFLIILGVFC